MYAIEALRRVPVVFGGEQQLHAREEETILDGEEERVAGKQVVEEPVAIVVGGGHRPCREEVGVLFAVEVHVDGGPGTATTGAGERGVVLWMVEDAG